MFKRAVENIRKFFVLITISNTSKNIIFSRDRQQAQPNTSNRNFLSQVVPCKLFFFFFTLFINISWMKLIRYISPLLICLLSASATQEKRR